MMFKDCSVSELKDTYSLSLSLSLSLSRDEMVSKLFQDLLSIESKGRKENQDTNQQWEQKNTIKKIQYTDLHQYH